MSFEPKRLRAASPVPAPEAGFLPDHRIVALARAACAPKAPLRRPFLRGRWRAAHVERVAAAVVALGIQRGEIATDTTDGTQAHVSKRLTDLLAQAPIVADGLNSLAEFIGGRAASHPDRLGLVSADTTLGYQSRQRAPPSAD
jgi:hypothetical protein